MILKGSKTDLFPKTDKTLMHSMTGNAPLFHLFFKNKFQRLDMSTIMGLK